VRHSDQHIYNATRHDTQDTHTTHDTHTHTVGCNTYIAEVRHLVDDGVTGGLGAVGVLDVEGNFVEHVPDQGVGRAAVQDWVLLLSVSHNNNKTKTPPCPR
jgi:hypothetical protein